MLNARLISDRIQMLAYLPCRAKVAELGVLKGDFSKEILRINEPKELHLVDIDMSQLDLIWDERKSKVFLHEINDLDWLPKWPKYFDWLYIDTTHTYEHTKQELILSHIAIKDNGYICGHDYSHVCACGPKETWVEMGVIQAVNEFCRDYNYELKYLTNEPHRFLSYVLEKK